MRDPALEALDRAAALREMRRVLARNGLSVRKSPNPYNAAVGEAFDRFTGAKTAAKYRSAWLAPDAMPSRKTMVGAGFRQPLRPYAQGDAAVYPDQVNIAAARE